MHSLACESLQSMVIKMSITQSFLLAIKSLSTSKMRSFLTMLGIIIGVAAVIALVSLVSGMQNEVISSFESMGLKNISVTIRAFGEGTRSVSTSDMQEFVDKNEDVIYGMTPTLTVGGTVKRGGNNTSSTTISGVSEVYGDINSKEITSGRFLSYLDVQDRMRSCIIGTYVAAELFSGVNPVGEILKINGDTFSVVGILKETADSEEGSADDQILIPYTTAEKMSYARVSSYTVAAVDNDTVDAAKLAIERFLYSKLGNSDLYMVISMAEAVDTVNEMLGMMSSVLTGIAAISLLVGGIGIMNIMLVSVTERTREIGVRKALGATPWDILSQFVVEAITTSAVGGVIGIVFGAALASALAGMIDMKAVVSVPAVLIAFSVSAGIGVAFGYFPARKASKMNPIDALRFD